MSGSHVKIQIGEYEIHQGDDNPCTHAEKLWLYNGPGEGMEVRVADLEKVLDKFFKEKF